MQTKHPPAILHVNHVCTSSQSALTSVLPSVYILLTLPLSCVCVMLCLWFCSGREAGGRGLSARAADGGLDQPAPPDPRAAQGPDAAAGRQGVHSSRGRVRAKGAHAPARGSGVG